MKSPFRRLNLSPPSSFLPQEAAAVVAPSQHVPVAAEDRRRR